MGRNRGAPNPGVGAKMPHGGGVRGEERETEMRREGWIVKQQEETFVDYVHYDGFMSINVCQNSSNCKV